MNLILLNKDEYWQSEFAPRPDSSCLSNAGLMSRSGKAVVDTISKNSALEVWDYNGLTDCFDYKTYRIVVFGEIFSLYRKDSAFTWDAHTRFLHTQTDEISSFIQAAVGLLQNQVKTTIKVVATSCYRQYSPDEFIERINLQSMSLHLLEKAWLGDGVSRDELSSAQATAGDIIFLRVINQENQKDTPDARNILNYSIDTLIAMHVDECFKYILNIEHLTKNINEQTMPLGLTENGIHFLSCWLKWKQKHSIYH